MNDEARKKNNERVIALMKEGSPLGTVSLEAIFFPPRPIIKKDPNALRFPLKCGDEKTKNNVISINKSDTNPKE